MQSSGSFVKSFMPTRKLCPGQSCPCCYTSKHRWEIYDEKKSCEQPQAGCGNDQGASLHALKTLGGVP